MKRLLLKNLTVRVLVAIFLGMLVGYQFPEFGSQLKFLGEVFIRLIKMVIAPVVFFTVTLGIGNMGDMKKVGIIGAKTLLYFEIVTTLALAIGLVVVQVIAPGAGFDTSHVAVASVADLKTAATASAGGHGIQQLLLDIVPDSVVGAFARGDMLPVLLFSVLFGSVLSKRAQSSESLFKLLERLSDIFFGIVNVVMVLSPIAAFGAMAYTVGEFGLTSLLSLGKLMASVYTTMFLFVAVVLGGIARIYGFSLLKLLRYLREEILLVLGTSSSETVLPNVMSKLEEAGCSRSVVGLVIPTGYSFNLDGTAIYLSMATLFIAQAYNVQLSFMQILTVFGILMLTSKGAAGVTGSGFVTLAATLAAVPGNVIPVEGVALVLGVDRFMSEARAITNLIGNSVATVVIAKHEGEFKCAGKL